MAVLVAITCDFSSTEMASPLNGSELQTSTRHKSTCQTFAACQVMEWKIRLHSAEET